MKVKMFDELPDEAKIIRKAVSKEYHGKNYSADIIKIVEQEILNRGGAEVMYFTFDLTLSE